MKKLIRALMSNKTATNHVEYTQRRHSEISEQLSSARGRTDTLYRLVMQMKGPEDDLH